MVAFEKSSVVHGYFLSQLFEYCKSLQGLASLYKSGGSTGLAISLLPSVLPLRFIIYELYRCL